jgi:hypothetical protein
MSFLHGYGGGKEKLFAAAPVTERILQDIDKRLKNALLSMREGKQLVIRTDEALYSTWKEEGDDVLMERVEGLMTYARIAYGLNCFHEDLNRLEQVLSDPLFPRWWAGKRVRLTEQEDEKGS